VIYRKEGVQFPFQHQKIGRALGPSQNVGNAMAQWILTGNGEIMPIQTLRCMTDAEKNNLSMKDRMKEFDDYIQKRFGNTIHTGDDPNFESNRNNDIIYDELYESYDENENKSYNLAEMDEFPDHEIMMDAEVMLPKDGGLYQSARVIGRSKNASGNYIGNYHPNPVLNTQVYDVMFPDGAVMQYSANLIAENIMSQVDEDGHIYQMVKNIVNHRKGNNAIGKCDGWIITNNGTRRRKLTTKGWSLEVEWNDGTTSWVALRDMKESHPIETAEYCEFNQLADKPAMSWQVPFTLKKKKQIISKVKSKSKKKNQKYGISIPRSVKEALELHKTNGNTLWRDAIAKEMKNVRIAFDVLDKDSNIEPGRTFLECYLIFDVKMDFTRKARFVANGAKTPDLKSPTGIISRETVRIAFTHAALNGYNILAGDILNAYLNAPIPEKYWTVCGPEFGSELEGCKALIVRALYGTKSDGRDFCNHLRSCIHFLLGRSRFMDEASR